ncbi:MAG: hypothetical protein NVS2B6_07960 [Thermoleophilaceae bacterium]
MPLADTLKRAPVANGLPAVPGEPMAVERELDPAQPRRRPSVRVAAAPSPAGAAKLGGMELPELSAPVGPALLERPLLPALAGAPSAAGVLARVTAGPPRLPAFPQGPVAVSAP